jgi:uncharacterized oxidoreductase
MGAGGSVVENKKILITGGGSGIGLGLTERFVQLGSTVIICGRREDVLQAAKEKFPSIITKVCDLESETSREELFKWIQTEHENLDVLINNAGIQQWVGLEDPDFMKRARQEIAINVEAPLHLSHMFIQLPKLKTIMNVTSGLSYVPFAKVPVYSATKAFLHSFTASMRHTLAERGVEVIEIIPPALNTDLGAPGLHDSHPPVSEFIDCIFKQLEDGERNKLTFGMSKMLDSAGPAELEGVFKKLNGGAH